MFCPAGLGTPRQVAERYLPRLPVGAQAEPDDVAVVAEQGEAVTVQQHSGEAAKGAVLARQAYTAQPGERSDLHPAQVFGIKRYRVRGDVWAIAEHPADRRGGTRL